MRCVLKFHLTCIHRIRLSCNNEFVVAGSLYAGSRRAPQQRHCHRIFLASTPSRILHTSNDSIIYTCKRGTWCTVTAVAYAMRLLKVEDLSLVNVGTSKWDIPPYAILSHTWGVEEVTFLDILEGTGRHKSTWNKIVLCKEQAENDGFSFIWIDTCCIDKSNSSELTEAVNSMYDWYAHASICYVYLQDVSKRDSNERLDTPQSKWQSQFRFSRWFTRGWTLQELIAPLVVVFYSSEWTRLGDKHSLQHTLYEITSVPTEVLNQTKQCNEYSISERMRWASRRQCSRPEDEAYCLMGLFDVNMPLIYGEGHRAFQRLQKEIMSLADHISGLRLLNVKTNPLAIETFGTLEHPKYAILSHTWNTEEVSYQDILLGRATTRKGYNKIEKACKEAARRGLKYLWVDTCCIDKKSSAELQEAICSMYKWYKNAQICYVYLEDYDAESTPAPQLSACRWFKRGWTLRKQNSTTICARLLFTSIYRRTNRAFLPRIL
jgi:hypothetical protein